MSDKLLQKMVEELAEIRKMLGEVLTEREQENSFARVEEEIAMVEAEGIDPIEYLKEKYRRHKEQQKSGGKKEKPTGA